MPPVKATTKFFAKSTSSFDVEHLELCCFRAAERQNLLVENENTVNFGVEEDIDPLKTEDELVQEIIDLCKLPENVSTLFIRLLRCCPGKDIFAIVADRDLVDPLSMCLFISDIKLLYEAPLDFTLAPLEMQFDEFTLWKSHTRESNDVHVQQLAFWQTTLAKPLPSLELPADHNTSGKTHNLKEAKVKKFAMCDISLDEAIGDRLRRFALENHITTRSVLLSAFFILLIRYTDKRDVIVGSHYSGRGQHVEIKNLIGSFESWLPVRLQSADHPSVRAFVERVATTLSDAEANPDIGLSDIEEKLGIPDLFQAAYEVYGNTVDDYSFPLITTRLLRNVLGLEALNRTPSSLDRIGRCIDLSRPRSWDMSSQLPRERSLSRDSLDPPNLGSEQTTLIGDPVEYELSISSTPSVPGSNVSEASHCLVASFDDETMLQSPYQTKPVAIGGINLFPIPVSTTEMETQDDIRLVGVTSPLIRIAFQYNTGLFKPSTVRRMTMHFRCILEAVLKSFTKDGDGFTEEEIRVNRDSLDDEMLQPSSCSYLRKSRLDNTQLDLADRISEIPIMRREEEQIVMERFNQTETVFSPTTRDLLVHELVERQARDKPDNVAVSLNGGREVLSYAELDSRANQLANFLQLIGATHEMPIPVLLNRSSMLVVSWLGVLKSGGAIMPMDTKFPAERVRVMIADADASIIITESSLEHLVRSEDFPRKLRVVVLDRDWQRTISLGSVSPPHPAEMEGGAISPSSLAYIIYTSGSTGKPKGVMLEHRAIVNYIHWHIKYYEMVPEDRVFACAGLAFDASMADTWPTLAVGACLLPIVDQDTTVVPSRFLEWAAKERATMGFLTTQICEMVLEEDSLHPRENLSSLRVLYTGGDRLHFGSRLDAPYTLVNIYGPTENTINSTMTVVPKGLRSPPTIGSPVPNTQCFILDPETMLPVPIGVYGELFLSGVQLARGYFNLKELSEEKFIPNPFILGGDRLYKTGDLVRWLENGDVEFQGRKDTQVKIRGNRVELTAIESVLLDHDHVRDAVVIAREDVAGQKRLVAYLVLLPKQPERTEVEEDGVIEGLRQHVKDRLPLFMLPSAFVLLESLPLTPNHKIDRAALPPPSTARSPAKKKEDSSSLSNIKLQLTGQSDADAPIMPLMLKMKSVWSNILGIAFEGIDAEETGFFEAGGDSLSAGRVTAQMSRLVNLDLPVSLMYKFPTIQKYCQAVLVAQSASSSNQEGFCAPGTQSMDDDHDANTAEDLSEVGTCLPGTVIDPLQASFNEESLWLVCQREDTFASQAYNVPFSCKTEDVKHFLDENRLLSAVERIVAGCETLRTVFREPKEGPINESKFRVVERHVLDTLPLDFDTSKRFQHGHSWYDVKSWLEEETYRKFDFENGPLFRIRLAVALDESGKPTSQYFLLVVHHIVVDLWSIVLLLDRLFSSYYDHTDTKICADEESSAFSRHIQRQRRFVKSRKCAQMVEFWKSTLSNFSSSLELPTDFPRPAKMSFRGGAKLFKVDSNTTKCLQIMSQNTGFTMNVLLLTAFCVILRTYVGTNQVQVGVPAAGRTTDELEEVFGYFVNPVVIGTDLSGNPSLIQLLHRVSMSVLNSLDNQQVPFPYLVEQLLKSSAGLKTDSPSRTSGGSENPLFNVAYVLQRPFVDRPGLAEAMLGFDGVHLQLHPSIEPGTFSSFTTPHCHAQFDLTLMVCVENGHVCGSIQYNSDIFSPAFAERLGGHFVNLLEILATCEPEKARVSDLRLISTAEEIQVMEAFNSTQFEIPEEMKGVCVHHLVERQAAATPDKICVDFGGSVLTYKELDERSNRLANFLRFTGVKLETMVPVLLERGIDLIIAWLGVLKSGGVVMPMDPKYPTERVRIIIEDGGSGIVITQESLQDRIPSSFEGRQILIDSDWADAISLASSRAAGSSKSQPNNTLAYAIYTSGSTGKPKGVMLEHRSLVNYIAWHIPYYKMTADDRVFACAGLAFDASMADTWPTLAVGACLFPITDPNISVVPHHFISWLIEKRATMGFLTTQICEMVLEEDSTNPRNEIGDHLRVLYTGGDRLHFGPRKEAKYQLVNIYGPTENTINSSMTFVENGLSTPPLIGSPVPNTQCYVLDPEFLIPVPIGVYGELFLSGIQLARGYFKQPELTAEKFIPNPGLQISGERLYRTGDLVRWTETGQLDFLGRKDTQVKIRGNRIELTAIESTILENKAIKECVVVARDRLGGSLADKILVAYFVAKVGKGDIPSATLKTFLKERLPTFMIPSAFVQLSEFPLTSNHKIDRAALPTPDSGRKAFSSERPAMVTHAVEVTHQVQAKSQQFVSSTVKSILAIFAAALGRDEESVSPDDDFFEEGGHSLSAARIMSKVRQEFGIDMPLSKFLQNPTVQGVSRFVDNALKLASNRTESQVSRTRETQDSLSESSSVNQSFDLREPGNTSFPGSSGSKVRFSAHSVVSSSYRDSAISEWLQDKRSSDRKRDLGSPEGESLGSSALSGSGSYLRRLRDRLAPAGSYSLSSSPLSMLAHSPMWLGGNSALESSIRHRHRSKLSPSAKRPQLSILSYNQQSLWFMQKMNPNRVDFVVHVACKVESDGFSVISFERALQNLVDRHESLRTLYGEENGTPYQIVYPPKSAASDPPGPVDEERQFAKRKGFIPETIEETKGKKSANMVDFFFDPNPQADHAAVTNTLEHYLHSPWSLETEPPFRARVLLTHDGKYIFLLTAHHIAIDGWSLDILLQDLGMLYESVLLGSGTGDNLPSMDKFLTVSQFAKMQKEEMNSAAGNRLWSFWQRQLAGHEANLGIPTDYDRIRIDKEPEQNGGWFHFEVPSQSLQQLQAVMKLERSTLFMALLAFYAGLLHRYTGKEDILIGTPMACRTVPELDRTVGNITNVVVLRMHVGKEDTFRSLLRQARAVVLSAFEHQELPFAILVERMSSYRQTQNTPIFQVLLSLNQSFSFDSGDGEGGSGPSLAELEVGGTVQLSPGLSVSAFQQSDQIGLDQQASPYDLQLIFSKGVTQKDESEPKLFGAIQYKTTLFRRETIERMAGHLLALISGSVEHNQLYARMPLLSRHEEEVILRNWNNTKVDFPTDLCVHEMFESMVKINPFATAVSMSGRSWTYYELNSRANILARYLRFKARVEPGCKVGILVERSPNMILAMLAVAKSGGAYVPMDIGWPSERLTYVFRDSDMTAVLCDKSSLQILMGFGMKSNGETTENGVKEETSVHCSMPAFIAVDHHWDTIERRMKRAFGSEDACGNLSPPSSSSWGKDDQQWHGSRSTVYMIYTSGSTGNPKGVLIEHRALVNVALWHKTNYGLTCHDRASQLVGAAFDPVGLEVWPFLAAGASIHIVDNTTRGDVNLLSDWLHNNRISVSLLPTPVLEVFLRGKSSNWPSSLRILYGGGDKLHVPLEILKKVPFRLDNHYGPSEGTIMCTFFVVNDLAKDADSDTGSAPSAKQNAAVVSPSIGRPLSNYALFVLDEYLEAVPILVPGELCIAGPGLAKGYHQRADLTAEKFLDIPPHLLAYLKEVGFEESVFGTKLYKTGDRVRYKGDGNIEFIGRVDFQVKIRGMRVELGEIESVVKQHHLVLEACVLAREDKPGQQRLCAYVVLNKEADCVDEYSEVERIHELQALVKDKLPAYMVPSSWVFLPQLPLTQNGKVDRKALPPPSERISAASGKALSAIVQPRSAEELTLAGLWQETLGIENISVHDNFFDLGGHSLAATQLLSLVRDTFNVELSIGRFFADPSIAGMAEAVAAKLSKVDIDPTFNSSPSKQVNGVALEDSTSNQSTEGMANCKNEEKDWKIDLGFDPHEETQLEDTIAVDNVDPVCEVTSSNWKVAFLTGGTGFLGSFLVKSLLEYLAKHRPNAIIICLVRGRDTLAAIESLRKSLEKMRLADELSANILTFEELSFLPSNHHEPSSTPSLRSTPPPLHSRRPQLCVVKGDLSLPYLGLGKDRFVDISRVCDIIFHAGAYVHSLFPYSRLKAANVNGTKEVLRLACRRPGAPAVVVHISTLSVFSVRKESIKVADDSVLFREDSEIADLEGLSHLEGYAQTKWVAEHLVLEAGRRGLPVVIFRPGRITGHSETGMANFSDFMYLFLKGCLQIEAAPELNWVMDMNPVDFVCESVLQLSLRFDEKGKHFLGRCFNMCNPAPIYLPEYFRWVSEFGYKCPLLSYQEWREKLIESSKMPIKQTKAKNPLQNKDEDGSDIEDRIDDDQLLLDVFETGAISRSIASTGSSSSSSSSGSSNSTSSLQGKVQSGRLSGMAEPPIVPIGGSTNVKHSSISSRTSGSIAIGSNSRSISSVLERNSTQFGSRQSTPRLSTGLQKIRAGGSQLTGSRHSELRGNRDTGASSPFQPLQESIEFISDKEEEIRGGETDDVQPQLNALYPLLPMFSADVSQMDSDLRIHFQCTYLVERQYPSYDEMNGIYFERMIQQEFIPPPPKESDLFTLE